MKLDQDRAFLPDPMGWLHQLPVDLRDEILRRCSEVTKRQGEVIYRADDTAGGIFTIMSGRIDLHWPHMPGGETLFYALGPGWWIGDLAALSGKPRRFDLVAGRDSKVLHLARSTIQELSRTRPEFLSSMLGMVTATLRGSITIMEFLSIDHSTIRTAACLAALNATGQGWNGQLPFSQAELAVICKISRRRMNSALNELQASGAVALGYKSVSVKNADLLESYLSMNPSQAGTS